MDEKFSCAAVTGALVKSQGFLIPQPLPCIVNGIRGIGKRDAGGSTEVESSKPGGEESEGDKLCFLLYCRRAVVDFKSLCGRPGH